MPDHGGREPMRAPLRWLGLALMVILVDLGTKALASSLLDYAQPLVVIEGFFDLRLLHNYGAAFSFLADHSGWQRWLFALIAVAAAVGLSVWMARLKQGETLVAVALALIIGGAVGNLFDRMVHGYVVDFLSFHWRSAYYFPAFNIADSTICVGAAGLIWDALRSGRRQQKEERS